MSSSSPTSVNTDRLWSPSECTSSNSARADSAFASASIVARSRPSEKFGTASSGSIERTLGALKAYYDRRAPEYDEWYLRLGRFDGLERPNWDDDLRALERSIASLSPARTLDVGCGTGFLTRHLRGDIVGLDQSEAMLDIARARMPAASFVRGDALRRLRFADASFDRVFTAHFYGHLEPGERAHFLAEARRLAREMVVVDSAPRPDREREERQERFLNDGSCWEVYKRYFTARELAQELGGGEIVLENRWFVAVRSFA
jgi:SAM-dependent methyltransferase